MENNYWDYNKQISATKEEMEKLLQYEILMFQEICNQLDLPSKTQFERNLPLESLANHTRILIDFFYGKKKYQNDLVAQDLLPNNVNWQNERPSETKLLKEAKNKADKQLAHLSLWRIKIEKDNRKGWDWQGIKKDIDEVIEKFENF
ncbi:MAG: hypothetical protein Q8N87_03430 [bacterium]|nr:hypothetical protein [bacterium]